MKLLFVSLILFSVYFVATSLPIWVAKNKNKLDINAVCSAEQTGQQCDSTGTALKNPDDNLKKNSLPLKWSNLSKEGIAAVASGSCVGILFLVVLPAFMYNMYGSADSADHPQTSAGRGTVYYSLLAVFLLAAVAIWYPTYNSTRALTSIRRPPHSQYNNISTTNYLDNQKNFSVGLAIGFIVAGVLFAVLKLTKGFSSEREGGLWDNNIRSVFFMGLISITCYAIIFGVVVTIVGVSKKPTITSPGNECCTMRNPRPLLEGSISYVVPSVIVGAVVLPLFAALVK